MLYIYTADGIPIHRLPFDACCSADEDWRSPEDMDRCPICMNDPFGEECIPEACPYYME